MKIKEFVDYIETKYPLKKQCEWDHSGVVYTHDLNDEIKNVITCLDPTLAVVEYALTKNVNLIISHHPIFPESDEYHQTAPEKKVLEMLKQHQITLISYHTNFDNSLMGLNYHIVKKLGLEKLHYLENGAVIIGTFRNEKNLKQLLELIRKQFKLERVITSRCV